MAKDQLKLSAIFKTINEFNVAVAKNWYNIEIPIFHLKYCITQNTLHSFYGERCHNCSNFIEPNLEIDEIDMREFKKHFGGGFPLKLIEILDEWPKKNHFPYLHNDIINQLPEYTKLTGLFSGWAKLTKEEKLNEIFDLDSLQRKYFNTLEEAARIRRELS